MINRLFFLPFLAFAFSANAQVSNVGPVATRSGNSFAVAYPSGGSSIASSARTVGAGPSPGTFTVTDALQIAGPAGFLPVAVTRGVSAAAVGVALAEAGAAATGIGLAALGIGAYQIFQDYRVRKAASGLEHDPGTDPSSSVVVEYRASWSGYVGPWVSSKAGALSALMGVLPKTHSWSDCTGSVSNTVVNSTTGAFTITQTACTNSIGISGGAGTYNRTAGYNQESRTVNGCPSIVDALTGQGYVPGVGADGKCLTGRYEAVSTGVVAGKLASAMTVDAVRDYINSGLSVTHPVAQSTSTVVSGPASQVGSTTTNVVNSGNSSVTTSTTPTYNYAYGGTTVNYSTVNNVVTNNTVGGVTTTTTETKPQTDQAGTCELYPNSVGCLQLGSVPDAPITPVQKSVTVGQETVSLPSGCPADVALPGGRTLSYASACAAAEDVAPLVIAAGVLSALLIAVAAIRGS